MSEIILNIGITPIARHAPSTAALARNYIQVHIQPSVLGQMEIRDAQTVDYQIFLRDLLMHGNKCKLPNLNTYGQPLSHWTVTKIRQILITAGRWAVKEGIIPRSYAEETEPIPIAQTPTSVFTIDNQRKFLQYTRNHRFYVAYVLFYKRRTSTWRMVKSEYVAKNLCPYSKYKAVHALG